MNDDLAFLSKSSLAFSRSFSIWILSRTFSNESTSYQDFRIYSIFGSRGNVSKFIAWPQPNDFDCFWDFHAYWCFTFDLKLFSCIFFEIVNFLPTLLIKNREKALLTKSKKHEGLFPQVVDGQASILNQINLQFGHCFTKSRMSFWFPVAEFSMNL